MVAPIDDSHFHAQRVYPPRIPVITSLSFSPNGVHILAGTAGDIHYIIDSHEGYILHRLRNHEGLEKVSASAEVVPESMVPEAGISGQECGWTPDGRFVYSGESLVSLLKGILVYDAYYSSKLYFLSRLC